MPGVKYKREELRRMFLNPTSTARASVQLGISTELARDLIYRIRKHLFVFEWVFIMGPEPKHSMWIARYCWRVSPDVQDAPKPANPTSSTARERAVEINNFKRIHHIRRVALLCATTDEERAKAHREYEAAYAQLRRHRNKVRRLNGLRAARNRTKNVLPVVAKPLKPILKGDKLPVRQMVGRVDKGEVFPVNQDVFWMRSTA